VLSAPDPIVGGYLPAVRTLNGLPTFEAWWTTTLAPIDQRLTRTGPASFALEALDDCFMTYNFEVVFHGPQAPLHKGDRVALDGLTVTIEDESACGPTRLGFAFDRPLEDPSLAFLVWRDGRLRRYAPPPVGATEVLPVQMTLTILR
jgi:hypothetical protein